MSGYRGALLQRGSLLLLGRLLLGSRFRWFRRAFVVFWPQAKGNQREGIDLPGGFDVLRGLKPLQSVHGIWSPRAAGFFRTQKSLGDQRILNLFVTPRIGLRLPVTPGGARSRFLPGLRGPLRW